MYVSRTLSIYLGCNFYIFIKRLFGQLCLSGIDSILKLLNNDCRIFGAEDGCSGDNDITA